jgi:hypothetical protein
MPFLITLAAALEATARRLRRTAGESARPDAPTRVPATPTRTKPAPADTRPPRPATRPEGYWRCTHARDSLPFSEFEVGRIYLCRKGVDTSSRRIEPWAGSIWAPYWSDHDQRFCYPKGDLDFQYVGTKLPQGETVATLPPAHILERMRPVRPMAA